MKKTLNKWQTVHRFKRFTSIWNINVSVYRFSSLSLCTNRFQSRLNVHVNTNERNRHTCSWMRFWHRSCLKWVCLIMMQNVYICLDVRWRVKVLVFDNLYLNRPRFYKTSNKKYKLSYAYVQILFHHVICLYLNNVYFQHYFGAL